MNVSCYTYLEFSGSNTFNVFISEAQISEEALPNLSKLEEVWIYSILSGEIIHTSCATHYLCSEITSEIAYLGAKFDTCVVFHVVGRYKESLAGTTSQLPVP